MYTEEFLDYLRNEKNMSDNTLKAYRRDVTQFVAYEATRCITDFEDMSGTEIVAYFNQLKKSGKSSATLNRKLAAVRAFFNYLMLNSVVNSNPTVDIKTPKIDRKRLEFLKLDEVEAILELPDESIKGIRDKALLEVLYATGMRVSEIIEANVEDVNMRMGFITCDGEKSKARIVPLGRPAREALENYIYDCRKKMLKSNIDEKALFVNFFGKRITRQGLWKILKGYGETAGIKKRLTPNVIRNSFAVHMLQNGADIKSLKELMGHEDLGAIQAYLSVTKNRIKDVYDKSHPRA